MTIHILDCATMNPWFPRWHLGTPCLLIETDKGLILVDTGLGLHDFDHPSRLVRFFLADLGIENDPEMTAIHQLARRGFQPEDVKDIVQTHLHFDHAGGLPDFPHARVHVHRREYEAVLQPRGFMELAFNQPDFAHNPSWVL